MKAAPRAVWEGTTHRFTKNPTEPPIPGEISIGSPGGEVAEAKRLPAGPTGEGGGQVLKRRVGGKKRGEGRCVIGSRSTTFDNTSPNGYIGY